MSQWGRDLFGDPCRDCGFSWMTAASDARVKVAGLPGRLMVLGAEATGDERHPDLSWSVAAYVAHVGDNLRVWAERVAGIALGGPNTVASYDENELARARVYDDIGLAGALWSLQRSVCDWLDALDLAPPDLTMVHPEAGVMRLDDIILIPAHDALHHEWDIQRSLETESSD